jgi:hypothetical protein
MEQLSMFSSEEPPVNPLALRASEKDWQTRVATWPSTFLRFLTENAQHGFAGRTCPASYPPGRMVRSVLRPKTTTPPPDKTTLDLEDEEQSSSSLTILIPSPAALGNSGMVSRGECLTHSFLEYPSDAVASSLSDILETGDLPQRFFLSATACQGILRRAAQRGKELPLALKVALEAVTDGKTKKKDS